MVAALANLSIFRGWQDPRHPHGLAIICKPTCLVIFFKP